MDPSPRDASLGVTTLWPGCDAFCQLGQGCTSPCPKLLHPFGMGTLAAGTSQHRAPLSAHTVPINWPRGVVMGRGRGSGYSPSCQLAQGTAHTRPSLPAGCDASCQDGAGLADALPSREQAGSSGVQGQVGCCLASHPWLTRAQGSACLCFAAVRQSLSAPAIGLGGHTWCGNAKRACCWHRRGSGVIGHAAQH